MNLEESIINEEYHFWMISELIQIAKVLASDLRFNVHLEKLLENPEMNHHIPQPCGECTVCKNKKLFPQINKEGTKGIFLDLFVFGDYSIDGKLTLKNIVKAIKSYPNVRRLLLSASRSRSDIESGEIKKVLFMLIAHGLLKIQYDKESNDVLFSLAKSYHDASVLAIQYNPYWEAMNTLVDLTK